MAIVAKDEGPEVFEWILMMCLAVGLIASAVLAAFAVGALIWRSLR